jgi:hypothetical protein
MPIELQMSTRRGPTGGFLPEGMQFMPSGKYKVDVKVYGTKTRQLSFAEYPAAEEYLRELLAKQVAAKAANRREARAANGEDYDEAEWERMKARSAELMRAILAAEAVEDERHRQKEAEAARCVAEEAPHAEWRHAPIGAFEPVREGGTPLTEKQKAAIVRNEVECSSAGEVRWWEYQRRKDGTWRKHRRHQTFGFVTGEYLHVRISRVLCNMHHLICWTFHGAPTKPGMTADHKFHCTHDNRASQLVWLTPKQQIEHQRPGRAIFDSWPIEVRVTADSEWRVYANSHACERAIPGVSRYSINMVLSGHLNQAEGLFGVRRGAPFESQLDLPPKEVEFQGETRYLRGEEWKSLPSNARFRLSTHNRAQRRIGATWGPCYTPRPRRCDGRAQIANHIFLYRAVWDAFCPDRPLAEEQTIDHIDQDHANDYLYNLRPATSQEQNLNSSRTRIEKRRRIECANPHLFFDSRDAFDKAVQEASERSDFSKRDDVVYEHSKKELMDEVVRRAKRVLAGAYDADGVPERMPTKGKPGHNLWVVLRDRFGRGKEFAERMGMTIDKAKTFIDSCRRSGRPLTPPTSTKLTCTKIPNFPVDAWELRCPEGYRLELMQAGPGRALLFKLPI